MGLLDSVKKLATKQNIDKAKGLAAKNADKISGAVDKATTTIDQKTGGKYRDKLDKVSDAVEKNLEKAKDETDDDRRDGPDAPPAR
jgi:gas vesicle protein